MASPWFALVVSLATVGVVGGERGPVTLRGEVVGADGRPISGAELVAAGGAWDGEPPVELGRATADSAGRFSLELRDAPSDSDRPTLWAIGGGNVVASRPIDHDPGEDRPYRLVLESPSAASVVVAGPDGKPVEGARVIPTRVAREVPEVPEVVARLAMATTGRDGRVVLDAFRPEELVEIRVEAAGFGIQVRRFSSRDGMAEVGTRSITLVPVGKVAGRVIADDPASVAGLIVRVTSPDVAVGEATTDAAGRFAVEAMAAGPVTVRVRPRPGQADLPARIVRRKLEPGQTLEVEVPLRRGVKVVGVVVDAKDGAPVAGALVSVIPPGPSGPVQARTDDLGRYEAYVPSGLVGLKLLRAPVPYLGPPPFVGPRPVEVPAAIARFELPKVELARGVDIRGVVIDETGRAIGGARVEAVWTWFDGRTRAPRSATATARADGSFQIGPVAPDAEVALSASSGDSATVAAVPIRPAEGKAVALTLAEPDALPLVGRVVDLDGRGIAGASVRIWAVDRSPSGTITASSPVRFDGPDALTTDADGRYTTPRRLRVGREYLALASAEGRVSGRTDPLRPTGPGSTGFVDLILDDEPGRVTIEGRVVDRRGCPVVGASVRTSGEGPCRREATTGLDGRFRLRDLPDCRSFLFAEAEGFRFVGRPLDPTQGPFDLILTKLDEEPGTGMASLPAAPANIELARQVLAPYADRVLAGGDHASRIKVLELLARVDPERLLGLIEAKRVEDLWFADHLRHAASCHLEADDPDERLAIVEAIRDPEWRSLARLDLADALPRTAEAARRDGVEAALRDARAIVDPSRRVASLAKAAGRLVALGEASRARAVLEELQPVVESLPATGSGALARAEFAGRFARFDPVAALNLAETLPDPGAFDRCRIEIARTLAARDPARASKILGSVRDPRSLASALPELCHALAPVDPDLARRLIATTRTDDPCLGPYAMGMMALAVSAQDKPAATAWLREAFDRLVRVAASLPRSSGSAHDPATVAAALLPVVERVDPQLVPELFWRAVSLHVPRPGAEVQSEAVLAVLLARYDREIARFILDPVAARPGGTVEADLGPVLSAAAVLDPMLAVRLVESLPEAPDSTFHHPRNQAMLALAAALVRGSPASWDHAVSGLLGLWTDSARVGE